MSINGQARLSWSESPLRSRYRSRPTTTGRRRSSTSPPFPTWADASPPGLSWQNIGGHGWPLVASGGSLTAQKRPSGRPARDIEQAQAMDAWACWRSGLRPLCVRIFLCRDRPVADVVVQAVGQHIGDRAALALRFLPCCCPSLVRYPDGSSWSALAWHLDALPRGRCRDTQLYGLERGLRVSRHPAIVRVSRHPCTARRPRPAITALDEGRNCNLLQQEEIQ